MPKLRLFPTGCAIVAFAIACIDQSPTDPDRQAEPAIRGGLRVTPAKLAFTVIGEAGTLTATTAEPGALTASVSSPACVAESPRRITRSPAKFTVTATAPGTCTVTIADGTGSVVVSVRVTPLLRGTLVSGSQHTCGLTGAGAAYCWGTNRFGQLGTTTNSGVDGPNAAPLAVQGNLSFTRLAAGTSHTCGITALGVVYCWGVNVAGELGITANTGTGNPNPQPTAVNTSERFVDIKAGSAFTCGLKSDGVVLCWGFNAWGQIGSETNTGSTAPNPTPNQVPGGVAFAHLYVGERHACGLTSEGNAFCWGANNNGQLGTTLNHLTGNATPTPQAVAGNLTFTSLAAGGEHTCGITAGGAAYCWGGNDRGALGTSEGYDTGLGITAPAPVEGNLAFTALAAGKEHTCGLAANAGAYCWGRNIAGQLGRVVEFPFQSPDALPVSGGLAFIQLSAFGDHTCGVIGIGAAYCWGRNNLGQLGTTTNSGTSTPTPDPQPVSGGFVFATP